MALTEEEFTKLFEAKVKEIAQRAWAEKNRDMAEINKFHDETCTQRGPCQEYFLESFIIAVAQEMNDIAAQEHIEKKLRERLN